ncbi:DUF2924 domain-containing protein [Sphingorhabdus arenilitoris]|uniref:DUF2924 domain-containing protein n=1 Tax=Sphingorhabdus arenilitoris TaxID=1490041 RepID=A0ABV8RDY8_9SPHN
MKQPKQAVKAEVAAIASMNLSELRALWRERFGDPPTIRAADLIRRVLAWRIQADAYGGFDAATCKMLGSKQSSVIKTSPAAGMRLAREWQGMRYEVTVLESGIFYEGVKYGSLSEVARLITGIRWNGPRFFGLRESNKR